MRYARLFLLMGALPLCRGAVPTPRALLGFTPGDDYKLADCSQIYGYFKRLAAASDRIRLEEFGRSALGKPMYAAFVSAPENLRRLDRYRAISRRLALGEATAEEARALAEEGRAIVWIDSGLHASEVAPAQQAPELAWRIATGEDPETRAIRQNVILVQIPVINPDGLDWVAHWYQQNVGTPYETAPLPWLYQKYAGHDNNRDYFMLNLPETRNVTRLLFHEWFPQIVYNQHQTPPFPARIFVPPYGEPLNPHIPAAVMEGISRLGMAMKERFARENKPGVLSYFGFDAWWNGGLREVPAFHNMHGILTETAGYAYATPHTYGDGDARSNFGNGMPTRQPSMFYERPWPLGKWTLRDAIDYMLTADYAILTEAAARRADYLLKSWNMAQASIAAGRQGKPYAYALAPEQWDRSVARELLDRLALAGVQVRRARAPFQAGGKSYPAGTWVLPAAQAFRPYLVDLLEPQQYPELKSGSTGPTKRPYDIAGWTLSMQMGLAVDRIDDAFGADLALVSEFPPQGAASGSGPVALLDHRENAAFLATAFFLQRGEKVRWAADGAISVETTAGAPAVARQFGVSVTAASTAPGTPAWELRNPRVGLYNPWLPNADEGWTEWVLDHYHVPFTILHNADVAAGRLRDRFDTIILAAQAASSILNGVRHGEIAARREGERSELVVQRPAYTGGIGPAGLLALDGFVREGGTLVALDTATELPIHFFPLPVRNLVRAGAPDGFYCPGSLIRLTVDSRNPVAFGMPQEAIAFSTGGEAFETTLGTPYNQGEQEVKTIARYAAQRLLASGWISGERAVLGQGALVEARHGRGSVLLFGFRTQFRGQPFGTFKFLLNAVYLGSAERL